MAISKITNAERDEVKIYGLPDKPGLSKEAMQQRFDGLGNLAIDKINEVIDSVNDSAKEVKELGDKVDQFGEGQIPEEYVQSAVETYVNNNQSELATKKNLEELDNQLSSEIAEKEKDIIELIDNIHNVQAVEKSIDNPTIVNAYDGNITVTLENVGGVRNGVVAVNGKNFMPIIESKEQYGVTVSQDEDGTIHINGTTQTNFAMNFPCFIPKGIPAIQLNNPIADNTLALITTLQSGSTSITFGLTQENRKYTYSNKYEDYYSVGIKFSEANKTYNDFTFKPMITIDGVYHEYENPTAIFAHTTENVVNMSNVANGASLYASTSGVVAYKTTEDTVITNKLNQKKIAFFGDSITYASGSYAHTIPENNNMIGYNLAVGGMTFAIDDADTTSSNILKRMRERVNYDLDYIIFQGGVNDAFQHKALGVMLDETDFTSETDESTFGGAFESACRLVVSNPKWIGKKVGFIANAKIPRNTTLRQYIDLAKQICKKYSIPVLDLWNESGLCAGIQSVNDTLYEIDESYNTEHGGGTHPNALGYAVIYDKVEEFIKRL